MSGRERVSVSDSVGGTILGGDLRWLWRFMRPYRRPLAVLLLLFSTGAGLGLAFPLILRHLVDRVFGSGGDSPLFATLGVLAGVSVVQISLSQFSTYRYTALAGQVVLDLRLKLFRHLERVPLTYLARTRAGDLASRLGGDTAEIQQAATAGVLAMTTATITLAVSVTLLLVLDARLFAIVAFVFPLAAGLGWAFGPLTRAAARRIREANANLGSTLLDSLTGQHVLRAHGLEVAAARRFFGDGRDIFDGVLSLTRLSCWSSGLNGALGAVMSLVVLGVGGRSVLGGTMSLGDLLAFHLYAGGVFAPVQGLLTQYLRLQRARVSLRRVREVLAEPAPPSIGTRGSEAIEGHIHFDDVSFNYEGRPVFEHLSFTVDPGEIVAVTGRSGIGKSTLLDVAIGIRVPTGGMVRVDGHPLSEYRAPALGAVIGVVSQDVALFHGSIAENLRLVRPTAGDDDLWHALDAAGLAAWARRQPRGLDTPVGERALRLSAGERQRMALARVWLRRPKILILDEAGSALDPLTDEDVWRAFASVRSGAATLLVSHRPEVIRRADRVIDLDRDPAPPRVRRSDDPILHATGAGVRVGVVDTGVHADHPHVGGGVDGFGVENGLGAPRIDDDARDRHGHGTACCAVIRWGAPDVELVVARVLDARLRGSAAALAAAIAELIRRGVHVVNLSLGVVAPDARAVVRPWGEALAERGIVLVTSASPEGDDAWPSARDGAVVVSADPTSVGWDLHRDPTPGVSYRAAGLPRPIPGRHPQENFSGSSFAAPRVTAWFARAIEVDPNGGPAAWRAAVDDITIAPESAQ